MRRNSTMKVHGPGEVMWEPGAEGEALPGMFVVISGVVRLDLEIEGRAVPMFLGAGVNGCGPGDRGAGRVHVPGGRGAGMNGCGPGDRGSRRAHVPGSRYERVWTWRWVYFL